MTHWRLNLLAGALVVVGGAYIGWPTDASALSAAKCTATITYPDGSKQEIVLEGDKCSIDYKTAICTCE